MSKDRETVTLSFKMPANATKEEAESLGENLLELTKAIQAIVDPDGPPPEVTIPYVEKGDD